MKIPDKAKKVFTGVLFDVYQWKQKMFDNSIETFEMLKRADTVQIIATTPDKKILIARQIQPNYKKYFYSVFGGRVDKGEKPLVAAKRELLEESGYESDDWELINTKALYHKMEWNMFNYIARNCHQTKKQTLDKGEKIKVLKLNFTEFKKIILLENFRSQDIALDILGFTQQGKLSQFKQKLFQK